MPDTTRLLYDKLRAMQPSAARLMVLHIGGDQTHVAAGSGPTPELLVLDVGYRSTAVAFFKHNPPTPGEIENAIQWVEDEVTRARALASGQPTLCTTDARVRDMARLAGSPPGQATLALEQVEGLFDQLAARSQGRPASQTDIPDDTEFSANLLILREFMHHLQFESIAFGPGPK